jgi:hypothetical protein
LLGWLKQLGGQGGFANAGIATDPDQLQRRASGSPERSLQGTSNNQYKWEILRT